MSGETIALLALLGAAVGVFGTLVGAGGGFLLTPVLLLLYPRTRSALISAISLIVVFFNAGSGSIAYAHQRRTDFYSGIRFALAAAPGSVIGALLVNDVSRAVFNVISGVLLAIVAVWLLLTASHTHTPGRGKYTKLTKREFDDRAGEHFSYEVPMARGMLYSIGVGFFSSFLGLGGGVVHVPLMIETLGFPVHVATATSHFVLVILALIGTVTHIINGTFSHGQGLAMAGVLSAGVVVGAQGGAVLSEHIEGPAIQRLLGGALIILAVRLILSSVL